MSATTLGRRWINQREAAEYFGVTDRTIRRWIADGTLPAQRVGKKLLRIDIAVLDAPLGKAA